MRHSTIAIDVQLDDKSHPESIVWKASDSSVKDAQQAKAMMLAFWDGSKKSALHIDLWTKEMMVDEMAEFYYQMLVTMADTFSRATGHKEFIEQMKNSAREFHAKYGELRKTEMRSKNNL
jgi:gliding motility-associated protein GldC